MKKNMDNTIRNLINLTEIGKIKRLGITLLNLDESLNLISETLSDIDDDVDMLYNIYFKKDIDKLEQTKIIDKTMFDSYRTETSMLKNQLSVKANELNPCIITINSNNNRKYPGFYYDPNNKIISLSVKSNAYQYAEYFNGDINKAYKTLNDKQKKSFILQFKEYRVKSGIHHELAHWLDDTFNNEHIQKHINKRINGTINKKLENSFMVNHEVYAMLNGIKQVKRKYDDIWDKLTFADLIKLLPSLLAVFDSLSIQQQETYFKTLQKKMYREGLLGKNMNNTYQQIINNIDDSD